MGNLVAKFLSVITDAGERQNNEPGANHSNNCGPACESAKMQVLGYPDIEPQVWIDKMQGYGPGYLGGTMFIDLNNFIATHYPNPPQMEITSTADPLGAIYGWTNAGLMATGLFYSDGNGNLQPRWTSIGHYCVILAYDGAGGPVTIWNPDQGIQVLPAALIKASCQGYFDVCRRPITSSSSAIAGSEIVVEVHMNQLDAEGIVRLAFVAGQGHEPTPQQLSDRASYIIRDGSSAAQVTEILDSQESKDHLQRMADLFGKGSVGPPGPAGPAGPQGPQGPAGAPAKLGPFEALVTPK